MNLLHLHKFTVSTVALVLLPLSNASYAEDQKVYPGNGCHAYYPADPARLIIYQSGLFAEGNPGDYGVYIKCPIVRDNVSNLNGTKAAQVWVFKQTPEGGLGNVGCTLWSTSDTGGIVTTRAALTADFDSGTLPLDVDVNASLINGSYHLICYLPPRGGIWSYRINEY